MGLPAESIPVRSLPSFDLEEAMMMEHYGPVAGIDEAGRGPWAGPVVVAAVVLNPDRIPEGINDSKMLTAEVREELYFEIMATSCVGIAIGNVRRIDKINILQASLWGMRLAYRALGLPIGSALIDGNLIPRRFPAKARAVVGGDALSLSVAAASIIAKVTRDRLMSTVFEQRFPGYGFAEHKGYATPSHLDTLNRNGPTPIHRHSFRPVRDILGRTPPTE